MVNSKQKTYDMRFEWYKPGLAEYYSWEETEQEFFGRKYKKHFLVGRGSYPGISFSPLEDAALFARFADIPHTREAFALWANQYGRLGSMHEIHGLDLSSRLLIERFTPPESLKFYRTAHQRLAFATGLWECIKNKDKGTLGKILEVDEDRTHASFNRLWRDQLKRVKPDGNCVETHQESSQMGGERNGENEAERAADDILVFDLGQANRDLDDLGIARFCLNVHTGFHLKNNPVIMGRDNEGRVFLEPTSLLACMWYQLEAAIDEKVQLRRCEICGQWEDMSNHNKNWTSHKKCVNNKAVRKYREKREKI
jgi:hypothetical protein